MKQKPNHVCKNCRTEYYACDSCDQRNSWKKVSCSIECYNAYINAVLKARSKPVETFVTDEVITKEEFDAEITEQNIEETEE